MDVLRGPKIIVIPSLFASLLFLWKVFFRERNISIFQFAVAINNVKLFLHQLFHLTFFFFFLGLHQYHMEVPRLGTDPTATAVILAMSAIYTTAHCSAGPLTHWAKPGIEVSSSGILVRFVSTEPRWQILLGHFPQHFK